MAFCPYALMTTRILKPTYENIALCAEHLRGGGLVAFPTETVYALGAVATNAQAVKKVFDVKGRPLDKALIVAVADSNDIATVAKSVPKKARILIEKFMPGALTVLLDKADCIPSIVTAGSSSVAVRIPDNPVALKLLELVGAPVVVPSANTSDKPSPTLGKHVLEDLDGKIAYVLDGGASKIGIESTIVDVREDPPVIVRGGGVSAECIESAIGKVVFKRESPKQSSVYSPCADVYFSAYYDGMAQSICSKYDEAASRGGSVVILCLEGNIEHYGNRAVFSVGKDYAEYAHNLFALLRRADAERFDTVIAEGVKHEGIGASLINRLIKISGGKII